MTNIEILKSSGMFNSVEDIIANMDLVVEVLRDDVARILGAKGIVSTSFDDYYGRAVQILIRNISKKKHLPGIQKLLSCTDIEQGLKVILSKLRGHTHCEMQTNRKNSVAYLKSRYKNTVDVIDNSADPLDLIIAEEEQELQQQNQEQEIERLHQMVQNNEISAEKSSAGHAQLFFNL